MSRTTGLGHDVVLLFTKRPAPGKTKTRLVPVLGPEGAARVHGRLLQHATDVIRGVNRPGLRRVACVAPREWVTDAPRVIGGGFEIWPQSDGDLGERMREAFGRAFGEGASRAVVVGSDCPDLDAGLLDHALTSLRTHDACLGPALDGGYYLLGLSRPLAAAFEGVPWSDAQTGRVTLERLVAARAWVRLLPTLRDVDLPEDLAALAPRWPDLLERGDPREAG